MVGLGDEKGKIESGHQRSGRGRLKMAEDVGTFRQTAKISEAH